MNKNELKRVVAWRLKLLRQASDMPRSDVTGINRQRCDRN